MPSYPGNAVEPTVATDNRRPAPIPPYRPDNSFNKPVSRPEIPPPPLELPSKPTPASPDDRRTNEIGGEKPGDENPDFDINNLHCLDGYEKDAAGNCVGELE